MIALARLRSRIASTVSAPACAPELGVIRLPSNTSMYQRNSMWVGLLLASPSITPKSNGSLLCRALTVWIAASSTCVVDSITGE